MKLKLSLFTVLFILSSCGEVENGVDGVDGLSILVNSEVEPSGTNCPNGGTKLSFGGDINGNGVLSVDEVTSTFYVCNGNDGEDGDDGQDGEDGTSNLSVSIIEITTNSVDYIDYSSGQGGYLEYEYNTNLVTNDVLDNGMVFVETKLFDGGDNWMNLPLTVVSGDINGVDYTIYGYYHYRQGSVYITWECSLPLEQSDWLDIIGIWGTYYKISILTPTS